MKSRLVATAALAALVACGGSQANRSHLPSAHAVALMRRVPADTPFLIAALEPLPAGFATPQAGQLLKLNDKLTALDQMMMASASSTEGMEAPYRIFHEAMVELGGKVTAESLAKIGLGSRSYGAVFLVDLAPVLVVEVTDGAALRAALERVSARAKTPLPVAHRGAQEYWLFETGQVAVVGALRGNELTIALLPRDKEALLGVVLDGPPAGRSLADNTKVADLLARYHWMTASVGWIDLGGVARGIAANGPVVRTLLEIEPACATEIGGWFADWPNVAFGSLSFTQQEQHVSFVVQTSPETTRALGGLRVPIPGWSPGPVPGAKLELGIGMNGPETMRWLGGLLEGIGAKSAGQSQCQAASEMRDGFHEAADSLRNMAALPFADVRGLALVLHDLDIAEGVIRAMLVVGVGSPELLLGLLDTAAPGLMPQRPTPGGPAVEVQVPDMGNGIRDIHVATATDAIGLSIGPGLESGLQALLALPRAPDGALLHMRGDRAFFSKLGGDEPDPTEGGMEMSVEVDEGGVVIDIVTRAR